MGGMSIEDVPLDLESGSVASEGFEGDDVLFVFCFFLWRSELGIGRPYGGGYGPPWE
jgi:hypothetical protein